MSSDTLRPLLGKPYVLMGVVNVTPDSFYDGGWHNAPEAAVDHGLRLSEQGADVLDIGGESTRPGAAPIAIEEELRRVLPVVEKLAARCPAVLSVDTTKAEVAQRALDAGASWINDISAGRFDSGMPALAAARGCPVVLMHSRETPRTMQDRPGYSDVVAEVRAELAGRIEVFVSAGVARDRIIVDPGIGFGKRLEDNLALLAHLDRIADMGLPVLVGTSRKSFVGVLTGKAADQRLWGTLGSVAAAYLRGAKLFRVHDVAETADCLKVLDAIMKA